jgi:hypothetical protein
VATVVSQRFGAALRARAQALNIGAIVTRTVVGCKHRSDGTYWCRGTYTMFDQGVHARFRVWIAVGEAPLVRWHTVGTAKLVRSW